MTVKIIINWHINLHYVFINKSGSRWSVRQVCCGAGWGEIMPRDLSEPVLLKVSQPNYLLPN